jgi:hypothetical protein
MRVFSGYNGIYIESDNYSGADEDRHEREFYRCCLHDLHTIQNTPTGADLLRLIGLRHDGIGTNKRLNARRNAGESTVGCKYIVTIRPGGETTLYGGITGNIDRDRFFRKGKLGDLIRMPGEGDSVIIRYKPYSKPVANKRALDMTAVLTEHHGIRTETFIVLAHELIHALHDMSGDNYKDSVDGVKREELYTAGVGAYRNTRISENAIRRDAGLPRRETYYGSKDELIGGVQCYWFAQSPGGSAYRL